MDISHLNLLPGCEDKLREHGINTVQCLVSTDPSYIQNIKGIGTSKIADIFRSVFKIANGNFLREAKKLEQVYPWTYSEVYEFKKQSQKFQKMKRLCNSID
jgi:predicted RecB family nuclease